MGLTALLMDARRTVFSFNSIALVLLAVQNSGYLVLISYSQQSSKGEPLLSAGDEEVREDVGHAVAFKASHFLATAEFVKLLLSLLWCTVEEFRAIQKEQSSLKIISMSAEVLRTDSGDSNCFSVHSEPLKDVADEKHHTSLISKHTSKDVYINSASHTMPLLTLGSSGSLLRTLATRMRHAIGLNHKYKETLLMIVPAIVYSIQGLLLIYALKLLDPTLFQVLYQVRILFLAFMMKAVLDFRLSAIRWCALLALMFGIALAQLGAEGTRRQGGSVSTEAAKRSGLAKVTSTWSMWGTLAALAGGLLSAFSGVFMEFVLKKRGNHFSLAARNAHLAFFSLLYFFIVFLKDILQLREPTWALAGLGDFMSTFFDGFTGLVWSLVFLQAIGGMLVAVVVRYCDNIVKSFSTAVAIVLSGTASVFLIGTPLGATFISGSCLVMVSTVFYGLAK